jgi:hypothetical protein
LKLQLVVEGGTLCLSLINTPYPFYYDHQAADHDGHSGGGQSRKLACC